MDGIRNPVYDKLQRAIASTDPCQGNRCAIGVQAGATAKMDHKKGYSVDLGELRGFIEARQGKACGMEMTEMGTVEQRCPRRFSVDMGQVREFIALREMKTWTKEKSTTLADETEAQEEIHNDKTC